MKSNFKSALIIAAALFVSLFGLTSCNYNGMVELDEAVTSQWAQVQNQYQRRYDLIPNLVNTVKGYAKHEAEVLEQVTQARSNAGGVVNVDESILQDPEAFERYQKVQDELGASLQRLLVVTENYPELKADKNFLALQDELAGTENRIAVERKRYNDLVKKFNATIRKFRNNLWANKFGFEKREYFAAESQAQSAPKVEF